MEIRQHLRFAARQLRRNPGFTATVIITLALSIGANTAIFSLLNALMLKSLPYSHAERMGTIYTRVTGFQPSDERHGPNGEQWELLRDDVPSLISAVSNRGTSGVNLGLLFCSSSEKRSEQRPDSIGHYQQPTSDASPSRKFT